MSDLSTLTKFDSLDDNIVCLHSSLGSSRQWSGLMDLLNDSYCICAPDLIGYGSAADWRSDEPLTLLAEVNRLSPLLESMNAPIHLVGHSYGAAVALKVAERYADRIASLTIYEPVLFPLLFASDDTQYEVDEIFQVHETIQKNFYDGDNTSAARQFIDYWSGRGSWDCLSCRQQTSMSEKVHMVLANFEAIFSERNAVGVVKALNIPTFCLYGEYSPNSTIEITRILAGYAPHVTRQELPAMGHMGPVTHSDIVNSWIKAFISSHSTASQEYNYPLVA